MDDPRVLRLVTIGLVLAALAVGYLLFTGGFSVAKPKNVQIKTTQTNKAVASPTSSPIPAVVMLPQQTATPSAYVRIANRTQSNTQTLPRTGFPVELAIIFSASAVGFGLVLRKFPK